MQRHPVTPSLLQSTPSSQIKANWRGGWPATLPPTTPLFSTSIYSSLYMAFFLELRKRVAEGGRVAEARARRH